MEDHIKDKVVKDALKYIITKHGELCVTIILIMKQQELSATCSDMDIMASLLGTNLVPAVDQSGWMMFSAVEQKQILHIVHTAVGENMTVIKIKLSLYHA